MRPQVAGRHYIILTLWEERQAFYDWQNSNEYSQTHKHRGTERGVDRNIVNRDLSYNVRIELSGLESKIRFKSSTDIKIKPMSLLSTYVLNLF